MAHLLNTVIASTLIVCGGLITHIATQLPGLGFRDSTPSDPSSLLSIQFLKNAHDIQFFGIRNEVKTYQWTLHPNLENLTLFLPSPGINDNLSGQLHDCIPGAIPRTIISYVRKERRRRQRRREGRDSEDEGEEEEESEEEEEDEEDEEEEEEEDESEEERTETPTHLGHREEMPL